MEAWSGPEPRWADSAWCLTASKQPQQSLEYYPSLDHAALGRWGRGWGIFSHVVGKMQALRQLGSSASSSVCPDSPHPSGLGFCPSASRKFSLIALMCRSLPAHLQNYSPHCLFLLLNILTPWVSRDDGGRLLWALSARKTGRQILGMCPRLNTFIYMVIYSPGLYWTMPDTCAYTGTICWKKK